MSTIWILLTLSIVVPVVILLGMLGFLPGQEPGVPPGGARPRPGPGRPAGR